MYKEEKIYVPKDDKLRAEIIRLYHNTLVEGYGGQQKTIELVTRNFWWLGVTKEMKQYIEEYDFCQRNKNYTKQPVDKLISNSIPKRPWTHISADFITKLLLVQEYDSILVVVDRLTKIVHFISTIEKILVEELVRLFKDNVQRLYRLSENIISDRKLQFTVGLMRKLNRILGIKSKMSMAFHPQTDRQIERVNQELKQYLRMFIDHRQEQWPDQLGTVEFAYNNKAHSSTKTLSFKVKQTIDKILEWSLK